MRARKPRILIRKDGHDLAFCHLKFKNALSRYVDKRRDEGVRITQTELCQKLADHLKLSQDSIDNYRKGYNGPASIEVVRSMADYLKVEWTELMKEVTSMADKKMTVMEDKAENYMAKKAHKQGAATPAVTDMADSNVAKSNAVESNAAKTNAVESNAAKTYAVESNAAKNNAVAVTCEAAERTEASEDSKAAPLTEFEKASTWVAVRDVYKALSVFVSFFEGDHSVVLDLKDSSSDPIIRTYNYCWKVLHRNMLDIPDQTYEKLEELITELGYWVYGLPETPVEDDLVVTDPGIRMDYFGNLFALELNDEMEEEADAWAEKVTSWLVDDFYKAVRQILKNFIPREPAKGMGCPQKNPVKEVE